MSETPDELAAGLQELAARELPPAGERFADGVRQTLRWEQRRRRSRRRRLVAIGCLVGLLAALGVALALPATARLLPLPIGSELRRLDARTSDLQARLAAQAAADVELRRRLAETVLLSQASASKTHRHARHQTGAATQRSRSYGGWVWIGPTPTAGLSSHPVVAPPLASAPASPTVSASPSTEPSP